MPAGLHSARELCAELGLAPLLVRPDLEVVEAYRGAPVASRLPEVVLVLAEVHLLDNGRQSIQTRKDKNVLVMFKGSLLPWETHIHSI